MPTKKKAKKKVFKKKAKTKAVKKKRGRSQVRGKLEQYKPMHLDQIEAANLEKLLGETFEGLSKFQELIFRDKQVEPRITNKELAARYKVSYKAIANAIYDDRYRAADLKLKTDIYRKAAMLRHKAMDNAEGYLDEPNKKSYQRFEMTRIFVQKVVDSDSSLPEPNVEGPEFEITDKEG